MMAASDYLQSLFRFGIKPTLDRTRFLLDRLGHPERGLKVVLIGGTNGKGSTAEFLSRMFEAQGYRVGLFTQPHLYDYRERFQVNHTPVSEATLTDLLRTVRPAVEACAAREALGHPTEFEVATALALLYFQRESVDVAVLEVGLGGRWDSTNVTDPVLSIITCVDLDHTDRLGDTVAAIAADKAHLARTGRALLTGEQKPEALAELRRRCLEVDAELEVVTSTPRSLKRSLHGHVVQVDLGRGLERLTLRMLGEHQVSNLALALRAAERAAAVGLPVTAAARGQGAEGAWMPGRLDVVSGTPLTIIDGANNPAGARAFAGAVGPLLEPRPVWLVLGVSADKDVEGILRGLAPLTETVVCTAARNPRALAAAELGRAARAHFARVMVEPDVAAAVCRAQRGAGTDGAVCATGSFFAIAEVPRETDAADG